MTTPRNSRPNKLSPQKAKALAQQRATERFKPMKDLLKPAVDRITKGPAIPPGAFKNMNKTRPPL